MPSQMSEAMTKMAAEEKLKIQELRVTSRGAAWLATARGSSASNSRNGSEGFCSTGSGMGAWGGGGGGGGVEGDGGNDRRRGDQQGEPKKEQAARPHDAAVREEKVV